ncbi:crotonase [Nocardia sp. ET3-3]|uniref:Crotonase n=1 Tax=Nocardia terrae TaxID=2675851 RepID=A0A7K1V3T0_9NOCA|nr:3-hydroxyacyl-CoA dehydrogenase NAD-binding domain-containing protein [Nocardia terrae]MVU81181.1 crotonase [Nocardia terrae]
MTAQPAMLADTAPVSYSAENRVAVLTIDNPPVNVGTAEVRAGLIAGLTAAQADPDVDSIVLIGSGGHFVSGSDLREFDGPVLEPQLPTVIAAIESSRKPVVAALSGTTLGGGFELALGCDGRIAVAGGVIGLPEITLGMIPGAGGTQRPLRLVGPVRTLELITTGERIPVEQAHREGLIDRIVAGDLRAEAVRFARELPGKRVLRSLPPLESEPGDLERAAAAMLRRTKARPHAVAAVGAVLVGLAEPAECALRHERAEFNRLRRGSEASALRHLFFARRTVRKLNRPSEPRRLEQVGVVGAGTMGSGIARAFAESGIRAIVFDQQDNAAVRAKARLGESYRTAVEAGKLDPDEARRRLDLFETAGNPADLADCDLVVEAVFEDRDVKRAVLSQLDRLLRSEVPIATNTSYLDVDDLATAVGDPGRVVGMHFFSPAHRAEVLEIVRARETSPSALDTALTAANILNKVPIIAGVCDGFIGNRIYNAYRRQCELMLEEGALPDQIDTALTEFGFAMGPFAVADMSGLDIAWRMRTARADRRDPRERYPDVADTLCEQGRFGQKSGAGWYRYEPGSRTPHVDDHVRTLIEASSERKGISRRTFSADEIVDRALVSMANEAALILADRVADRASDIDLMLTLGYGFPAYEGGITHWAGRQDAVSLMRRVHALAVSTGHGFVIGDLDVFAG